MEMQRIVNTSNSEYMVEKLNTFHGKFSPYMFKALRKGDVFRRVGDDEEFKCTSDAYSVNGKYNVTVATMAIEVAR